VGLARRAFDAICERAQSRYTQGSRLADKQLVQDTIAEAWMQLEQFRLLVIQSAWKIDKLNDYKQVRGDIAAVKVLSERVMVDIASKDVPTELGLASVASSIRLTPRIVRGLLRAISSATARACARVASGVDSISLARPIRTASAPSMSRPVKISSRAAPSPTMRVSRCSVPTSATMAMRVSRTEKNASAAVRRMSQAVIRSMPAPTHAPCTAAITGLFVSANELTVP
jgi:hypothetical protein